MKKVLMTALFPALLSAVALNVQAAEEAYPSKPILSIVAFPAGGGTDIVSRIIAQELQTVDDEYLQLVYAENPEKLEASYGRLIPVLVKAIQELQQQINELKVGK